MSKYARNAALCEYLESIGIDLNTVAEDGFSVTGYDEFVLDSAGDRVIGHSKNGFPIRIRREWPSPETAYTAMTIYTTGKTATKEDMA